MIVAENTVSVHLSVIIQVLLISESVDRLPSVVFLKVFDGRVFLPL